MPIVLVDWLSRKLVRASRSSLTSEAQAGANAVDQLEWVSIFWGVMLQPQLKLDSIEAANVFSEPVVVTDCKALFDAAHSASSGLGIAERRTAIEVRMMVERLEFLSGSWRWVDSDQQLSDGMTKITARQKFVVAFRKGVHRLSFDPEYVSAKKKRAHLRGIREDEAEAEWNVV